MRKSILLLLCLSLLCPCAASGAEQKKYVALTFDGSPGESQTRALLAGLDVRDARATFFLCGKQLEQNPELAAKLLEQGHEIGIQSYFGREFDGLSRRNIAAEISDTKALLPQRCPVRLLRPPGGQCTDAANQVARAMGFSVADWALEPGDGMGRGIPDRVRDGDILRFRDLSATSVNEALKIVDQLQNRGFTFVTVSELAKIRGTPFRPGVHYRSFPPET